MNKNNDNKTESEQTKIPKQTTTTKSFKTLATTNLGLSKRHSAGDFRDKRRKIPWRWKWQLIQVLLLLGKFHRQRSQASYSPWGCKESDTT